MNLSQALDSIDEAVRDLRARLEPFQAVLDLLEGNGAGNVSGKKPAHKKRSNPQWKRQGRYLQAIRKLPKPARVKVKRELRENGYRAAIRLARSLAPTA